MSRLLVLEDDAVIRQQLVSYLKTQGFQVTECASLAEAKKRDPREFDLLISDWNLGDGEGVDLVKQWRTQGSQIPIIMLTARTDVVDRVVGLELGANDYILKPYEARELLARVRNQLRQSPGAKPQREVLSYGAVRVDLDHLEVTQDGVAIELTKMEFDLLTVLMRAPGKVFTRDELLGRVWGMDTSTETRTVDAHVGKLRQKLGEAFIETVRGLGYRISKCEGARK